MTSTLARNRKSMLPSVADDPRWARIVARDKTADGHLWYSVLTTGVLHRLQGRKPVAFALSKVSWSWTFSGLAARDPHEARQ
jgi:hypothetical protein